ncbi:MAG: AsmA-like C-terminal region-containing protein [Vicinamibacterales bacterium]
MVRLFAPDAPLATDTTGRPSRSRRRAWTWVAAAATAAALAAAGLRWIEALDDRLHAELESWLSDRLASDVRVEDVAISLFPRVQVRARGLTLRIPNRPDLPPFVRVGTWSGSGELSRLGIRHFDEVRLTDVTVTVPPRRLADFRSGRPAAPPGRPHRRPPAIQVDRLTADAVVVVVMPRDDAKEPHIWDIRDLRMDPFSFDLASPFSATVDTPLPDDRAVVTGTAGPWPRDDFHDLPLSGEYVLRGRLDGVRGLRGDLTVRGRALGTLDRLATVGTATSTASGFASAESGALPLTVDYEALVDATNSDVRLTRVDAHAGAAVLSASGHVDRARGATVRHVSLHVTSPQDSEAADVLRLLVDGRRPPARGRLAMDVALDLAPEEADVLDRLRIEGTFDLRDARFLNARVQGTLDEMSARGLGRPEAAGTAVRADLRGRLVLDDRALRLSHVQLAVPGAALDGAGRYSLRAQTLDFRGVTRLDARLSDTQRGWRRWALKPFDFLLAKRGAGTRVVVDVRGTRTAPVVDVDLGASLRGVR